jgi:hypothetical protein
MKSIKRLLGITVLTLVATLGAPQAFAADGISETPCLTVTVNEGPSETPGIVATILDYLALFIGG